jgi:hypothetical protein
MQRNYLVPAETEYVPIPHWVEVVTGNPQINQALRIATTVVDDMRRKYHARGYD